MPSATTENDETTYNNNNNASASSAEDDFSSRMVNILNYGALNVAIGLGYQNGLFEAFDEASEPLTAAELAVKANNLNPRVVREWLGIVVSGDIVEIHTTTPTNSTDTTTDNNDQNTDPSTFLHNREHAVKVERFSLPKHRGQFLCRRGGGSNSSNLGVYCQEIPLLVNCVYPEVVDSFRTGAGISYSKYPPFQNFMGELADNKHRDTLLQTFLPSVDEGNMVKRLAEGNMKVLDLGCGEGLAISLMAKEYPNSEFVGIDLDEHAIATAQKKIENDLPNLQFTCLDATNIRNHKDFIECFDYVLAFDAIHDLCDPASVLRGIHDALKPSGGIFSMVDIKADSCIHSNKDHPMGPLLYTVSLMHCMQVAMVNEGRGLGMMWGRQTARQMLEEANFRNIRELEIPGDGFNLHFMAEK